MSFTGICREILNSVSRIRVRCTTQEAEKSTWLDLNQLVRAAATASKLSLAISGVNRSALGLVWFGEGEKFPVMQSMCLIGIVWNLDLDDGAIGRAHKVSFTKYMEMFYQTYRNVFMNFFFIT